MDKKLPGVFANSIDKQIDNNKRVYVGTNDDRIVVNSDVKESKFVFEKTIGQKIDDIFKNKKYVYKIPVKVVTSDCDDVKFIIGKNSKNLITIDNELIAIDSVLDISVVEQEKND